MKLQEIVDLNEVLDLNRAVEYKRNYQVEKAVKDKIKGILKLRGYSFKVGDRIYGVYHFSRNGHFELHFYDGTASTSDITNQAGTKSLKVYSTVFKVLLDWYNNPKGRLGQSIWIGYDADRKRIYEKLISIALVKYSMDKEYETKLEYNKLPEGMDCIVIKKKQKLAECIVHLDNN